MWLCGIWDVSNKNISHPAVHLQLGRLIPTKYLKKVYSDSDIYSLSPCMELPLLTSIVTPPKALEYWTC
jgi:hypothetical protein